MRRGRTKWWRRGRIRWSRVRQYGLKEDKMDKMD